MLSCWQPSTKNHHQERHDHRIIESFIPRSWRSLLTGYVHKGQLVPRMQSMSKICSASCVTVKKIFLLAGHVTLGHIDSLPETWSLKSFRRTCDGLLFGCSVLTGKTGLVGAPTLIPGRHGLCSLECMDCSKV